MNEHHEFGLILSCQVLEVSQPYPDPVQNILNRVCSKFGKHSSYLFVKDKKRKRVYMRQLCIYLMDLQGMSNVEIAEIFLLPQQNVWYHLRELEKIASVDRDVQGDIRELTFNESKGVKVA